MTELGNSQSSTSETLSLRVIISATVSILASLAAFVWLSLKHVDTTPLVIFVSGVVIPQMLTLFKANKAEAGVQQIKTSVAHVEERTNGPLSEIHEKVTALAETINGHESEHGTTT